MVLMILLEIDPSVDLNEARARENRENDLLTTLKEARELQVVLQREKSLLIDPEEERGPQQKTKRPPKVLPTILDPKKSPAGKVDLMSLLLVVEDLVGKTHLRLMLRKDMRARILPNIIVPPKKWDGTNLPARPSQLKDHPCCRQVVVVKVAPEDT